MVPARFWAGHRIVIYIRFSIFFSLCYIRYSMLKMHSSGTRFNYRYMLTMNAVPRNGEENFWHEKIDCEQGWQQ